MIGDLPSLTGFLRSARPSGSSSPSPSRDSLLPESNTFTGRLEKYLDDFRKGRAQDFDRVPKELARKSIISANILAQQNPEALQLANAYSTGLRYDQKARFVSNVADAAARISEINSAPSKAALEVPVSTITLSA